MTNRSAESIDYGFDAPSVMITLIAVGLAGLAAGLFLSLSFAGIAAAAGYLVAAAAIFPLVLGCSMLVYGLVGKRRMRDHMLSLIDWQGDERVLDVGTGRGLLLIGAAGRLRTGRATGIDIWRTEDLSGNALDRARENVRISGVEDRVDLLTEDARRLRFPDASFDVVLSLFCIHNIEGEDEQKAALLEIARVLKPGGRVLIGEWLPIRRYADVFSDAGLRIRSYRSRFAVALAPTWLVDADRPSF